MLGHDVDRGRLGWALVGLFLTASLFFVAYSFVGTFVFGVFIYYATRPVYKRLRKRTAYRSAAAAVSLGALALPFVLLLGYTIAIALQEFNRFATQRGVDEFQAVLQPYTNASAIVSNPETLYEDPDTAALIGSSLEQGLNYVGIIGTAALHVFIMIALAFYLLRDDHRISRWLKNTFGDDSDVLAAYMRAVDTDFRSIFFGNILNALMTGVIGALSYSVLNIFAPPEVAIPYAALLGLLAGAASLIPVVGMKLVYVPVAGYLFFVGAQSDTTGILWFPVAFTVVSFVVVDVIPDLVLRPYVSGRNLHVGAVMFAYIFGPLLFGWYGIFLGPILLVLSVHFAKLVLPELLASEPIQPFAVDPGYFGDDVEPPSRVAIPDDPEVRQGAPSDSGPTTADRDSPSGPSPTSEGPDA